MQRRDVLKLSALLALSPWLSGCESTPPTPQAAPATSSQAQPSSNEVEVIVIGAGASGLAAARALHDAGKKVLVLEGRDRLGGRVWSNRVWPDVALDMGASWIHGTEGNPLTTLADQYGLKRVATDEDDLASYDTNGQRLSDRQQDGLYYLFEQVFSGVEELRAEYEEDEAEDISLQAALDEVIGEMDLSANEVKQVTHAVNLSIEHEYAADVADLSMYYWDADGEGFDGGDVLFPQGYDQIFQQLAAGLNLQLGQVVTEVKYDDTGVTVKTQQGEFKAQQAVITLPVGVLQKGTVTFSPPLPANKQTALQHLRMGVLNKVYLRFSEVFWDNEDWIDYLPANKGEWASYVNIAKAVKQPILLCFNAGRYGAAVEAMTDEQIVAKAMQTLRVMYGAAIPDPTAWLITRWLSDPFAYGSYSYRAVNATSQDHDALAEAVGNRLFFAGEATSRDNSATVHGAYLSGVRAAQEILGK